MPVPEILMKNQSRFLKRSSSLIALSLFAVASQANVLMQGFYWNAPSTPAGGTEYWWDHLARNANAIRLSGMTGIWIPPVWKGDSGGYSMGYDPFDDYDIGSKNQKGTIPTRFGTRETLERACSVFRANGLEIYCDIVDNHRNGDDGAYNFKYVDAYGVAAKGRFGKSALDFHPNVAEDPNVPEVPETGFGRDLAPINGPGQWIYNGLISGGDWLTKALDLQGYRLDYVKGISTNWLYPFLTSQSMAGKFAVGEYYDGNVTKCQNWVNSMQGRASAFDFPLRFALKSMCDSPTSFAMSSLDHYGLAGQDPTHAVTFVENHDTDNDTNQKIYNNKSLAYAYVLTSEGYPTVFYKDWSTDPGCYGAGLQANINNLVWIHEKLASGTTVQRWKNNLVYVYERQGGSKLLVGLNNNVNPSNISQGYNYVLTCATGFGANKQLHDFTGHAPDVWTDGSGNVTLNLPAASNGQGYVCYAPVNAASGGFTANAIATTQEYAGASDLDIKPADNTALVQVCRVYVNGGSAITGTLYYDTASWNTNTTIYLELRNAAGTLLASRTYPQNNGQGLTITSTAAASGWYTFNIRSYNTNAANPKPAYWLRATYTGVQSFSGSGPLP